MECVTIEYGDTVDMVYGCTCRIWIEILSRVHVKHIFYSIRGAEFRFPILSFDVCYWVWQSGCNYEIITLTLYLPKFLTLHVSTASRPTGYVTFDIDPRNSGSNSTPWLMSAEKETAMRMNGFYHKNNNNNNSYNSSN